MRELAPTTPDGSGNDISAAPVACDHTIATAANAAVRARDIAGSLHGPRGAPWWNLWHDGAAAHGSARFAWTSGRDGTRHSRGTNGLNLRRRTVARMRFGTRYCATHSRRADRTNFRRFAAAWMRWHGRDCTRYLWRANRSDFLRFGTDAGSGPALDFTRNTRHGFRCHYWAFRGLKGARKLDCTRHALDGFGLDGGAVLVVRPRTVASEWIDDRFVAGSTIGFGGTITRAARRWFAFDNLLLLYAPTTLCISSSSHFVFAAFAASHTRILDSVSIFIFMTWIFFLARCLGRLPSSKQTTHPGYAPAPISVGVLRPESRRGEGVFDFKAAKASIGAAKQIFSSVHQRLTVCLCVMATKRLSFIEYFVIIMILVVLGVFIYTHIDTEVEYVRSNVDGRVYLVQSLPDKQQAADMLASINADIIALIKHMQQKMPGEEMTQLLYKNYNPDAVSEGSPDSGYTSFSVNKGEKLVICIRHNDQDKTFVQKNVIMYPVFHEVSHLACKEIGHTPLFWQTFKIILQEAINIGLYTKIDFKSRPEPYCGIKITSSVV